MIQLVLCGSLCENFNFNFMRMQKKKAERKMEMVEKEMGVLLTEEYAHIQQHLLNKLVQFTKSEYGFIAKPISDGTYKMEILAKTNDVTMDAEYRCFSDDTIQRTVLDELSVYIDNKQHKRFTLIQHFAVCPVVSKDHLVAIVVLCNKKKAYTKKEMERVKRMAEKFSYVFTHQVFQ